MADLATLKTRLAEAEEARHALAMGTRVVEVWRDGKRLKFSEANKGDLDGYITDLSGQIADIESAASGARPRRRFIGVSFG
ncbi:gpW family head-tail joining protein [Novosphingobium gossypii]|uniref:gpW family head-tail joining protein n=1 Tax=Novosphingobium gossypii TaxID=1604774 RepID=UPI003D1DE844